MVLRRADRRARRPAGAGVGRWANSTFERYVVQGLVDGTAGAARAPTPPSAPPSPATCAPTPCSWSPASPASASTSWCRHEERSMIQVLLWLPLAAGAARLPGPAPLRAWVATLGAFVALDLAIRLVTDFDPGVAGLQHPVDESWIPDLGVRYQLGVDGISLFLVLLTAVALVRGHGLVGGPHARAAEDLLPHARPRRDRDARRLPGPGPAAVRPLLRPDADPVLLPVRELGRGAPGRRGRGPDRTLARRRSR